MQVSALIARGRVRALLDCPAPIPSFYWEILEITEKTADKRYNSIIKKLDVFMAGSPLVLIIIYESWGDLIFGFFYFWKF